MLDALGLGSFEGLVEATVPASIRSDRPLALPPARTEHELLTDLRERAQKNQVYRSFLGMGYHDTLTPPVIQRNILEDPSWYTAYTPYQAEISQGRLEALLNYQTVVIDLTGLEIANASLLDEATAAAEAMMMFNRLTRRMSKDTFFVSEACHPQTIAVVEAWWAEMRRHSKSFELTSKRTSSSWSPTATTTWRSSICGDAAGARR